MLAVVAAVSSAGAKPPPGGDPPPTPSTEPRPRPTTTPPQNTTPPTPPPSTTPREIRSLIVTTDSVMAKAEIAYAGSPAALILYWGDNTATELRPPPAGSVVLRHEYAPEPGGHAFTRIVTANVNGEADTRSMRITPRYLVTQQEAAFTSLDACEPWYEDESEWRIERNPVYAYSNAGLRLVADAAEWNQDHHPTDTFPNYETLESSTVQTEMTADEYMNIQYTVHEKDPVEDDAAGTEAWTVQPDGWVGTEFNSLTFNDDGNCEARIVAYFSISLVRPAI
jgi:hypothetical protein